MPIDAFEDGRNETPRHRPTDPALAAVQSIAPENANDYMPYITKE
jgi:hypothetical protein